MNFGNNQYGNSAFGGLPVVTKNIIIINVIMFVLTMLLQGQGINLNDYFGLHHHLAPAFKPHQFITYIFMHGSITHLFFNMLGVFMFGRVLEQAWGPKRYLIFYIVTGLGAAIAQYIILHFEITDWLDMANEQINQTVDAADRASLINQKYAAINSLNGNVIVGASGSLFGLLGAYGMLFPNQMLYIYFLFPVKAKWLVIAYGAIELFSGIRNSPTDNVAHFAHLGGLFVGIILVLLWRKNRSHFY
ncbi:MAG: rhomboid family intramembrane serine protease [Bacteroidetes bacterium]|nr:rhomboid family intramembrane serine protease [Bacteroidota bacterium]